ncbi:MAG: AAA domain-containing protein [Aggregatibacter aphrophilus]|uniref:AAA domain-containing protein n=1 Tax=Aggregatibacter aphrophilus TaxID=732 RepID=UPI00291372C8|nr:AAA domain-containing protein [Aggregatibacter aphrophilus]MDU7786682.1 AAA domain-containing protein [Aggregatibacter aphrophilus]
MFADVFVDISEELSNRIAKFEDDGNREEGKTRQEKINSLFKNMPESGFLSISLVGDLALIERHRRAVKNLQQNEGCYAPYLSSYLFDIENANRPNEIPEITEWENKNLNDKQKSAVQKMLAAPDICLIQGPPGTGKTTVIAEACLQFAKRGETVLLASQAHDALDNALSRLQNHPELRAVRLAKSANRITEEGKQFTGESILSKHYVSLRNYVAKEYLQPFNELSAETEKLHEWVQQAEFVAHDLQRLREEYRTNQGRLKQAEQALIQAKIEFDEQQDIFRRHSHDIENIAQLIGLGDANIIPFNFIQDDAVLKDIARAKLKPLTGRLKEKWGLEKLVFENEDKALDALIKQVNYQHGGRGVLNVLTKYLFDPLAEFLFEQVEQPHKLKGRTLKVLQAGKYFDFELE